MLRATLEWLSGLASGQASPRIGIGTHNVGGRTSENSSSGINQVVIEIALGKSGSGRATADARLATGPSPERLRQVVRFCSQQNLPVGTWLITGLWCMPARVEQVARWVHALATDAGEAAVWIDTGRIAARRGGGRGQMPVHFQRRLVGHLRRLGCEVSRARLFSDRMPL